MSVGEVCNREVVIANREISILEAAKLMRKHHVGDVVVTEERNGEHVPVGILTDRDIVVELLAEEVDLNAVNIGDVMNFELVVAKEDDSLLDTIQQMQAKGVRRIPVVNQRGRLVGLLAMDDLVELASEQLSAVVKLIKTEQSRERKIRG